MLFTKSFSSSGLLTPRIRHILYSPWWVHVGNDSNLLIVFYVQIMPYDIVMRASPILNDSDFRTSLARCCLEIQIMSLECVSVAAC